MRAAWGRIAVVILCCTEGVWAEEVGPDMQLAQAQKELDKAKRLEAAGKYAEALPPAEHALQLREQVLGSNHPGVAECLDWLGRLHGRQGSYMQAEPLYRRALQILETALGKNLPAVAMPLNNLANLYQEQGAYERAEPLHQRALQILEATLGTHHPDVADSLDGLANLYWTRGAYERAEPLYRRGLQIREAALGKNHPYVAASLNHLANLYWAQGAYERAEPLYRRGLQILEAALGKSHPFVAESLRKLALLHVSQNHIASGVTLFERAFAISEERLRKETLGFSEPRLADFLSLLRGQDATLYNLLRERPSEAAVRRLTLTVSLLRKGRSMDEIADDSRTLYRSLGEVGREAFQRLRALRTRLAALSFSGTGRLSPGAYRARLQDLETEGDTLEAELAQQSSILHAKRQLPGPADVIARVTAALPPDGALIEIIAFAARPLVPPPGTAPSQVPSTSVYFALVLLPQGDIRVADLGPAAVIDSAVHRLRMAVTDRDVPYLSAAQELYRLVFRPIAPLLDTQRQLFISPDDQLSLVPFAILHDGTRFLADAYDFTYLASGRDLLPRDADIEPSPMALIFADPFFPAASSAMKTPPGATLAPWAPLPGTRKEAEAIRKLLPQARLLTGPAATKKALLEATAPGILHIATHGFYLEDAATPPATRGLVGLSDLAGGNIRPLPPDPRLRSGLLLAGAPVPATTAGEEARSPLEDSLVTALEISGMNLWGTQLVVLSGCDTGKGDVKIGQGVYGLRRAFTMAGAETVVTSLWRVNDETTQELMEGYYQRLLGGQGRSHALREAMEVVRRQHPHPYYWAPFIVVGKGEPLRGFGASVPAAPLPAP